MALKVDKIKNAFGPFLSSPARSCLMNEIWSNPFHETLLFPLNQLFIEQEQIL